MKRITGKVICKGMALGPVYIMGHKGHYIKKEQINDVAYELSRVKNAIEQADAQLQSLYEKAFTELGENTAAIFKAHQMMLWDEGCRTSVDNMIRTQRINAEYAVTAMGNDFAALFDAMPDEYMRARAADVRDVTGRILKCLCGEGAMPELTEPSIIVAEDLMPSDTVMLDKSKVLAFVTVRGSVNSHAAILARTMNIPAMFGVNIDIDSLECGVEALADGFKGEFIIAPTVEVKAEAEILKNRERENQLHLQTLKGKENITLSGKEIKIYANISDLRELKQALQNDAGGVGLFRSEFLFMGRSGLPGEEEQFAIYKQALQLLEGRQLIVRTMDIGADKQADYLGLPKEENPAMGYRAIRICLTRTDIFKTQLRALYRAAVYGNLSVMYPMIISVEEVEAIKRISAEVKEELHREGIPYKDVEEGIMIETPAAVMISDELAEMVDFFSIGTNDLTQYTLAIDRQNTALDAFFNPRHKAVVKMIEMVTENAHRAGKWVGICGELGADPEMVELFVKMGIDELSVTPSSILELRKIIRQIN